MKSAVGLAALGALATCTTANAFSIPTFRTGLALSRVPAADAVARNGVASQMDEILDREALHYLKHKPADAIEAAQYTQVDLDSDYEGPGRTSETSGTAQMDEIFDKEATALFRAAHVDGTQDMDGREIFEEEEVLRHLWPPAPPRPHYHGEMAHTEAEEGGDQMQNLRFLLAEEEEAEEQGMWTDREEPRFDEASHHAQHHLHVEHDHHHQQPPHHHELHNGHHEHPELEDHAGEQHDRLSHSHPDYERGPSPKPDSLGALLVRLGLLDRSHPAFIPHQPCPMRAHALPHPDHPISSTGKERSDAELAQELTNVRLPLLGPTKARHSAETQADEQSGMPLLQMYRLQGGPQKVRKQVDRFKGRLHPTYEAHGEGKYGAYMTWEHEHDYDNGPEHGHAVHNKPYFEFTRSPPSSYWGTYASYLPSLPSFLTFKSSQPSDLNVQAAPVNQYQQSPLSHSPTHAVDRYSHPHAHLHHPHTFRHRLHHALLALHPSEALIMAFILGAGIGAVVHACIVMVMLVLSKVGLIKLADGRGGRRGLGRRRRCRRRAQSGGAGDEWYGDEKVVRDEQEEVGTKQKEGEALPSYDAAGGDAERV